MEEDKLNILFDKEADVLYIFKGTPSPEDDSEELDAGIVIRRNSKSGEIRGITIIALSQLKESIFPMRVSFEAVSS